ncbi:peptidase domain-containing ABC transporter [Paenimyroides tangerinum]|uniref:Peptidase domain-containing ABC transporter n=2 Tax=Paenimyroides tangerinum TaxID=2488728 RepID=A0A3P3W4C9_9FLAO|nr:peptidase domain-containing ABC transporter [Paenimyroides tangerinum]
MKFIPQHDQMDCGPACLAMVASKYKKKYPLDYLREISFISREGVSLLGISEASKKIGFDTFSAKLTTQELFEQKKLFPCILHWNQNHFVVLKKITKDWYSDSFYYHIADPSHGIIKLSEKDFKKSWISEENQGIGLFLNPNEEFYSIVPPKQAEIKLREILGYLKPYKKRISILVVLLLLGSGVSLIFPFLTQTLIDKGVNGKDFNVITLILLAQLSLYIGNITIDIIRNRIMLYIGTNVSIAIISDFLSKVLKLPLKFFDTKMKGDFNQRIQDNERIEGFLTSQSLITFFSMITFLVFFGVLWTYNVGIMLTYTFLTVISLMWSIYWLKKRKSLDYFRFQQRGENQESIYEIINGVTEMKINHFEEFKRKEWEKIQHRLFKINIRILKIDQLQLSGFEFLNQIKNILVTFIAATLVVKDTISLGQLLAVSFIIGQLNSPINQLVTFFRSLQDAKLSLSRLNEVQNHPEEEQEELKPLNIKSGYLSNGTLKGIKLDNISFQYEGPKSPFVLKDIKLSIPEGKVTAVVGASGSGKTTLMKLLLRFYDPSNGIITYNGDDILTLSPKSIRENCGVVMQDGYIFSDTIERNIATGDENIDREKLDHAVKVANIESFIESLPLGYNTKIGAAGNGISGGQKQRILIARAVYKNPHYIFFDEATSALDAENEKIIHDNLQSFFKGKTVLIIAHRLSTVKNADQIIVLKHGEIVEQGNHQELVALKNEYYNLVKNQLELGS